MADEPEVSTSEDVCSCGHATEAHSDAAGCVLCECTEDRGRMLAGATAENVVVEAPVAEGGADGVQP